MAGGNPFLGHGSGADRQGCQPLTPATMLGVVLAGGHGRRMGGVAKPLLPLAGVPMVLRVAAALRHTTGAVVLATGAETARYASLGFPCLPDPSLPLTDSDDGRAGPLAAVLAGLDYAAAQGYGWCVTCPADVPLVPLTLGARLAEALRQAAGTGPMPPGITVEAVTSGLATPEAQDGIRWHPAIALLSVSLAPSLRQALRAGERRVGGWMRQAAPLRLRWPVGDGLSTGPDPFSNINTPDDLRRAGEALAVDGAPGDPTAQEGA